MSHVTGVAALVAAAGILFSPMPSAAMDDYLQPRATGMSGALRGEATGDAALQLNPSGMSLARVYTAEGGYQLTIPGAAQAFHASVVDSTTSILAAGAYYTYRFGNQDRRPTGHEAGLMLSVPFADRVAVGGGLKYFWLEGAGSQNGMTFDAGVTVKILQSLSVGVAGRNLRERGVFASPSLGYGVAFHPIPALLLAVDGEQIFETAVGSMKTLNTFVGGGEFVLAQRFALRAGGGRDGRRDRSVISAGLSLLSEVGALDVAFQQDLSGSDKLSLIAVSLRLFVPNAETSTAPSRPMF